MEYGSVYYLAGILAPEWVLKTIDFTRTLVSPISQEGIENHPDFRQIQNPATHIFGTVESFAKLFGTLASNTGQTQASNIVSLEQLYFKLKLIVINFRQNSVADPGFSRGVRQLPNCHYFANFMLKTA